jgi:hypothetical protein
MPLQGFRDHRDPALSDEIRLGALRAIEEEQVAARDLIEEGVRDLQVLLASPAVEVELQAVPDSEMLRIP